MRVAERRLEFSYIFFSGGFAPWGLIFNCADNVKKHNSIRLQIGRDPLLGSNQRVLVY